LYPWFNLQFLKYFAIGKEGEVKTGL